MRSVKQGVSPASCGRGRARVAPGQGRPACLRRVQPAGSEGGGTVQIKAQRRQQAAAAAAHSEACPGDVWHVTHDGCPGVAQGRTSLTPPCRRQQQRAGHSTPAACCAQRRAAAWTHRAQSCPLHALDKASSDAGAEPGSQGACVRQQGELDSATGLGRCPPSHQHKGAALRPALQPAIAQGTGPVVGGAGSDDVSGG